MPTLITTARLSDRPIRADWNVLQQVPSDRNRGPSHHGPRTDTRGKLSHSCRNACHRKCCKLDCPCKCHSNGDDGAAIVAKR